MTYDVQTLDSELRAQNLRIHGCASTGRIDWIDPPTGADIATAKGVLAAHDPTKRKRDERDAKSLRAAIADRLAAHTVDAATWRDVTAADRLEDTRLALRLIAMIARRMA